MREVGGANKEVETKRISLEKITLGHILISQLLASSRAY